MSGVIPPTPPTARSYLAQQLRKFRLAAKELRTQLEEIERKTKEVLADLVYIESALDDLEQEVQEQQSKKDVA